MMKIESMFQNVGAGFNCDILQDGQNQLKKIVADFPNQLSEGMSEKDATQILNEILLRQKFEKMWHPIKVRFAENTNCSFREESHPNIKLKNGDLFFVDLGPVFHQHEADYGETFIFNPSHDDPFFLEKSKLITSTKQIFHQAKNDFLNLGLSGRKLIQRVQEYARELGYEYNDKMTGHRIGDFPHHLYYRGPLMDCDEVLISNRWILEIHLRCEINGVKVGAFFEDILSH